MTANMNAHRLSTRIVDKVAEAENTDPVDLAPLYESIDPDALDALFQNGQNGSVTFEYENRRIIARADGDVTIEPLARSSQLGN